MQKSTKSIIETGDGGILVDIECHLSNSLPNIVIVGFANKSVDEAKERIRGAFSASGIKLPRKRVTINLAPADIPKEGSSYDLPMIVSILQTSGLVKLPCPDNTVILGEVGLDGSVRSIRGIIGKILAAKKKGINRFWIPKGNIGQVSLIPDIEIFPIASLRDLYEQMNKDTLPLADVSASKVSNHKQRPPTSVRFEDIVGQPQAKRAALIAAAGHHNLMLNGPPGTGKSMLAKALPSILPEMTKEEKLEVTHLHSLARKDFDKIVLERPIRSPHHSASHVSVVGGGQKPSPGEISLSHRGILFFDEFPEFGRSIIEALRQPIEDRKVTVSRAKDTVDFPAHFLLVATANPCPCGNWGSKAECTCLPSQILKYHKKISGPILDRIDLYINVDQVDHRLILKKTQGQPRETIEMKTAVEKARKIQLKRAGKLNSELSNQEIKSLVKLSETARDMLNQAAERLNLSARGYIRTLRVAQTIADLGSSPAVDIPHISEALQYRAKSLVL